MIEHIAASHTIFSADTRGVIYQSKARTCLVPHA